MVNLCACARRNYGVAVIEWDTDSIGWISPSKEDLLQTSRYTGNSPNPKTGQRAAQTRSCWSCAGSVVESCASPVVVESQGPPGSWRCGIWQPLAPAATVPLRPAGGQTSHVLLDIIPCPGWGTFPAIQPPRPNWTRPLWLLGRNCNWSFLTTVSKIVGVNNSKYVCFKRAILPPLLVCILAITLCFILHADCDAVLVTRAASDTSSWVCCRLSDFRSPTPEPRFAMLRRCDFARIRFPRGRRRP